MNNKNKAGSKGVMKKGGRKEQQKRLVKRRKTEGREERWRRGQRIKFDKVGKIKGGQITEDGKEE